MSDQETIFALASASGKAGVAVFRISGRDAKRAITSLCEPRDIPAPRIASLRKIKNAVGEKIDHALALYFEAPHSFTGEDVVEFHTHGGRAVIQALTEALRQLPGFRMAEAGEFTRRAFENGKMDLTEAEAIADLVHAETEAQRKQALRQLDGALGQLYENWRTRLARGLAYMEAAIDFSDEELPEDMVEKQSAALKELRKEISLHLDDKNRGERVREGFSIAIVGPPNAGKSSLLNALARRDAAIVSPIAGTTRDVIEVYLDIGGYAVMLADTAGLRDSSDGIESEGIRRAQARAAQADLKLLIFDGGESVADPSLLNLIDADTVVVVNKMDLRKDSNAERNPLPLAGRRGTEMPSTLNVGLRGEGGVTLDDVMQNLRGHIQLNSPLPDPPREGEGNPLLPIESFSTEESFFSEPTHSVFPISALTGEGIDTLLRKLAQEIERRFADTGAPPLTRARHRAALEECAAHLDRALNAPMPDLRAEDVRLAMRALGRITGRVEVEDLLDIIFRDFCIGK